MPTTQQMEVLAVAWFGSKNKSPEGESPVELPVNPEARKGKATPSRKEAELARRERIKPTLDKKAAKRRSREERLAAQDRALISEANRPANKLMRDYVDSRKFLVSEHALPIFMVVLLISFFTATNDQLRMATAGVMWFVMLYLVIEQRFLWVRFKKLAAERLPNEPLKGVWYYGFNRSIGPRMIRRPRPEVARGAEI